VLETIRPRRRHRAAAIRAGISTASIGFVLLDGQRGLCGAHHAFPALVYNHDAVIEGCVVALQALDAVACGHVVELVADQLLTPESTSCEVADDGAG
jgi:hypothetical protein